MKTIIYSLSALLLFPFIANAQEDIAYNYIAADYAVYHVFNEVKAETIYLNDRFRPDEKDDASYKGVIYTNESSKELAVICLKDSSLVLVADVESVTDQGITGYLKYLRSDGSVESEGRVEDGIKVGEWKRYTKNGDAKRSKFYTQKRKELLMKYCSTKS